MLTVTTLRFSDLTVKEKLSVSNNGAGRENAAYIRVKHNKRTILLQSDAMEPEDARFWRDLSWIPDIIEQAYQLGMADAGGR